MLSKLKKKIYLFREYTRREGLFSALLRTLNLIRYTLTRLGRVKQSIYVMAKPEDVVRANYAHNPYIAPTSKLPKSKKIRIGWVLSPIAAGSGGHNTIMRFVRHLQSLGHDNVVFLYDGVHPQPTEEAQKVLSEHFHTDVNVYKLNEYTECDIVFASGWETAYALFNLETKARKFYFVQDFEPLFYATGSMSVLAENTYKFNFKGITAGKWLTHRLSTEYDMDCDYFEFGADLDEYKMGDNGDRKIISFYARPVTERRAFELGVIALQEFHRRHPGYEIHFFGWDVSDFNIPFPYVNRKVLTHKQLAELYNSSVACLVLSLTNVSLLPLELLAAGCVPVMNTGDNNTMVLGENKYIAYSDASPAALADALSAVVETSPSAQVTRAKAAAQSVHGRSWQSAYDKVASIIEREMYE